MLVPEETVESDTVEEVLAHVRGKAWILEECSKFGEIKKMNFEKMG